MCSKKCAKPDLPGSTSLRDPVSTGICSETMFGQPVGTTITTRPFGSGLRVRSSGCERDNGEEEREDRAREAGLLHVGGRPGGCRPAGSIARRPAGDLLAHQLAGHPEDVVERIAVAVEIEYRREARLAT